ncbi:hypothetical protein CN902_26630 [Priestia megaterium]|uniref:hypothetical protein n=1 Tax=Priestia megaterium TaxID=1404 RepID=UPI000BFBFFA8|nr:hypothetical protein [Priestia megaterium]PGK22481.1 hypothetical protein CN902_26630 [Priestia megaterium]
MKTMIIWHLGVFKDDSVYPMTTYDPANGALQCFTSNNAIDFVFEKTILNDSSNKPELFALSDLYQPIPFKANNEWALYADALSKVEV